MNYPSEKVLPYSGNEASKGVQVAKMFDEIAPRYDLLNHALSFGIDRYWRKKGILSLQDVCPAKILDIATGTGDLAIQACKMLKPTQITGIDISDGMMQIGKAKVSGAGLSGVITFEQQDCTAMRFADHSFDAAMIAFGIRNFADIDSGLREILRVLRPGGKLMILELSTPEYFPMKQLYQLYSAIIPVIGRCISRSKAAYRYLPKSIAAFPQNAKMKAIMEQTGFGKVAYRKMTFGICTMYLGYKSFK
ncbi:MAG: bifunctional demethylmenaquinone methyltransferase/2-methoxy-6-polyprenyl-1,4-benzoquinol methylase UbiE [Bacteroidales bacterium]|jgi:demethylmenaquinone methyltransferase/2-methoxy-6-polyprenyl-1,4-benzoquinol methylase|nr:bifunctional demethylmenaquinone methyltransferase/2-methoxy-6-polyprenyl-1,4-benzoquinol methylase UbiE [Bacteroidales bacterium]